METVLILALLMLPNFGLIKKKKMTKQILIICLLAFSKVVVSQSQQSFASQTKELPQEKIYVHSNNNFLLTGETLYYTIYCLNNNNYSPFSRIAYTELIDSKNNSILKQRISLDVGKGYGDFFISPQIKTGSYKLVAYTQWMKNKNSFFQQDIFLVNPFSDKLQSNPPNETTTTLKDNENTNERNGLFDNLKASYSKRENVVLNLTNTFSQLKGSFSISIRKKNNFQLPNNKTTNTPIKTNNAFYLPELRGTLIQGKVTTSNTSNAITDVKLSLSTKNKNRLPITAITNDKGEFYFNIPELRTPKVEIQILDKNANDYNIELIKPSNENIEFENFPELFLNENISKEIRDRTIYSQIENAFYKVKKDSISHTTKKSPLLDYVQTTYILDDYKRFKTVKETFVEVIEGAGFIRNKGQYNLSVTNTGEAKTLKHIPSLLVIDGSIVFNHNDLTDFDSRKIHSISIVKSKYFYGNALYQGVVIIRTFKNDFLSSTNKTQEFEVTPVQPQKIYFFQNNKNIKNKRIPDFRTQLYWNPAINLSQNTLSFFTSDVTGTFEITLQGYTKEGRFINAKERFSVK